VGKSFKSINDAQRGFIEAQKLFFVSTAPLTGDGYVNLSPKGLDTFKVIGANQVAYLDLIGSGVETIAHLKENQRLTIMFCAFEGPPKILRLQGRGQVIEPGHRDWDSWLIQFADFKGIRSVIVLDVQRVADSCGYSVPLYEYKGDRKQLADWCHRKGPIGIANFVKQYNKESIDGLPGLDALQSQ
jgi:hypothetical protein